MADFAACDENPFRVGHFAVWHDLQKPRPREFFNRRTRIRMPQHALRRKYDQRLAPWPPRLPPQHVEILRRRRRLAHLNIFFRGKLQIALEPRTRMLWPLSFISVRQQHHDAGRQIPLVLTRANKLIDDHLRAVRKIPELRFPQNQRFRKIAAEPVFEAQAPRLGKRGIVNLAERRARRRLRNRGEGYMLPLIHCIDQHRMPLIERSAL